MRKLLLLIALLPFFASAQISNSAVKTQIDTRLTTQIRPVDIRFITKMLSDYARQADSTALTVPANVKAITGTNITNWNTAFGWGNHSGLYLPIAGGAISGTAGAGFIGLPTQSSKPTTPAAGNLRLYSNASNVFSVLGTSGFAGSLDFTALTADRNIAFPNQAGTVILSAGDQTMSGIKAYSGTLRFTGSLVGGTAAPFYQYNTADETTNYERSYGRWASNIYEIGIEKAGTGTDRTVRLQNSSSTLSLSIQTTGSRYLFAGTSGSGDQLVVGLNGTYSSGGAANYAGFANYMTVSNSGTSTYTAYYASIRDTGVSTGEKALINVGTNSTTTGAYGTHTSMFKVLFNGATTVGGTLTLGAGLTLKSNVSASATVAMTTANNIYVATGTTSTYTLPVITSNAGISIRIINRGSGTLTLNSNAGANDIYIISTGTAAATTSVAANSQVSVVGDGTYWIVL